jgi:hypothetical protein
MISMDQPLKPSIFFTLNAWNDNEQLNTILERIATHLDLDALYAHGRSKHGLSYEAFAMDNATSFASLLESISGDENVESISILPLSWKQAEQKINPNNPFLIRDAGKRLFQTQSVIVDTKGEWEDECEERIGNALRSLTDVFNAERIHHMAAMDELGEITIHVRAEPRADLDRLDCEIKTISSVKRIDRLGLCHS